MSVLSCSGSHSLTVGKVAVISGRMVMTTAPMNMTVCWNSEEKKKSPGLSNKSISVHGVVHFLLLSDLRWLLNIHREVVPTTHNYPIITYRHIEYEYKLNCYTVLFLLFLKD